MELTASVRARDYDNIILMRDDTTVRVSVHNPAGYLCTKLSMEQAKDLADKLNTLLQHETRID